MSVVAGSGFSPVPGGMTRSRALEQIARYVKMPDDPEGLAIAGQKHEDAVRELNGRNWMWALAVQDLTLLTDTAEYALNADVRRPRHLHLLSSTGARRERITFSDPKTFDFEWPIVTSSGKPERYTLYSYEETGLLSFDRPVASGAISQTPTARLRYFRRIPFYGGGSGSVIRVPPTADLWLVWAARASMAADFMPAKLDAAVAMADRIWKRMLDDENEFGDWAEA